MAAARRRSLTDEHERPRAGAVEKLLWVGLLLFLALVPVMCAADLDLLYRFGPGD